MAAALEQYVNSVRTLSSQGNFAQLCEVISKSSDVLARNSSLLDNVMATLDIESHSLGILGILCIKYSSPTITDFETLFLQTQDFINCCQREQVLYATNNYADLCHLFTQQLVDKKQAFRGILILVEAIKKIQLHPAQLTSVHADLCQLCLLAKCFKPALEFLETDINEISKEGGQFDAKHFLMYYYYGGMIYTALKDFDKALYFFEAVITTPSMAVSHIMMEGYKKYILVALILNGKVPSLPKYTPSVVSRYIKPLCQPYHDVVTAYGSNSPDQVRAAINKHEDAITRDSNLGLAKQVTTSLYKKNIQRLTKTFMTLSLADMANRVQLPSAQEAEKYVLHMIEDGEIYAAINQKDGMVRFYDNPEKYNTPSMLKYIDEEIAKCVALDEKIKQMDQEITINAQYVQKNFGSHAAEDVPGSSVKGFAV